jgi:hypothetical protein
MLNARERRLALLVLGVLGFYMVYWTAQRMLLGPIGQRDAQIASLTKDIQAKTRQLQQATEASDKIAAWEKISLPSDVRSAQSLYQEFLIQLVAKVGVEDPVITPVQPVQRMNLYTRIPFTIRGRASLEQISELLYGLYEPNLLHQVRQLTIRRTGATESRSLDVDLTVEGLALNGAPVRPDLIPGESPKSPLFASRTRTEFASLREKNIFRPYRDPTPPPRPLEGPREPSVDLARHVVLVASTRVGPDHVAWLYDRLTNQNLMLQAGDRVDVGGIKGKLVAVESDAVRMDVDGKPYRLDLGRSLREMRADGSAPALPVAGTPTGTPPPPAAPPESANGAKSDDGDTESDGDNAQ